LVFGVSVVSSVAGSRGSSETFGSADGVSEVFVSVSASAVSFISFSLEFFLVVSSEEESDVS